VLALFFIFPREERERESARFLAAKRESVLGETRRTITVRRRMQRKREWMKKTDRRGRGSKMERDGKGYIRDTKGNSLIFPSFRRGILSVAFLIHGARKENCFSFSRAEYRPDEPGNAPISTTPHPSFPFTSSLPLFSCIMLQTSGDASDV